MAILLLLHEPPEDEPAQQHDVANGFSNRSDGRPVSGCSPIVFVVGAGQPKSLHRLWPTPGPEGVSLFPQYASQGASTASRRQRSPLPRPPLRPRLPPSELLRQAYPGSLRDRPFSPPARAGDCSRLRALPWSYAVGRAAPQPYAPATIMPLGNSGFSPAGAAIAWFSNSF